MYKLFIVIFALIFGMSSYAGDCKTLPYKNLKDGAKITLDSAFNWNDKIKNNNFYYTKNGNSFYTQNGSLVFNSGCDYLFITGGKLIGYANDELKFYEFAKEDNYTTKRELDSLEVSALFKDFKVILISEFTTTTNVYKLIKKRSEEKIILINDTNQNFKDYKFSTNNSDFYSYNITGAIGITKKGLIQFTRENNHNNFPWFVLMVR